MFIDSLFEAFRQNAESEAVIWHDQAFSYGKLLDWTNHWHSYLRENRIATGTVTAAEADFSPNAIALMLALLFAFNLSRGISSSAWLPWITSLVPPTIRGRYVSLDAACVQQGT